MTTPIPVPKGERQVLRVFTLDRGAAEVAALRAALPDPLRAAPGDAAPLAALLGLDDLDAAHVDVLETADLAGLGLAAYLIEGDAAAEDQIAADRARLDALTGAVLILRSAALRGAAATLRPAPGVTLVGTYAEDLPPVRFEPLPDASAKGIIAPPPGKPKMSDARMGGMVATAVLILMFAFVWAFIRMAG